MTTDNISAYNNSLTPEEKSLASKQAGIRSGEVRRQNKVLRDTLTDSLQNPDVVNDICQALINKAKKGDVRAFEAIRNTIDPTWKNESLFQNENWNFMFAFGGDDDFGEI